MECNQYQKLLMRRFDHDLNCKERELLAQHLNGCPDCRSLYEDLHRILASLETAAPVEPDPGLEKMILEQIKTLPAVNLNGELGLIKMIFGWLAAALVLLYMAIHLTVQDAGLYGILLQGRQYSSFLSGIALDSQIFFHVISSVFTQAIVSISRVLQNICWATILFGIVLAVRFMTAKPANPKPDYNEQ